MRLWSSFSLPTVQVEVQLTEMVRCLGRRRCSSLRPVLAGNQFALPYLLEYRPSPEFSYEGGKNKLINLRFLADGGPEMSFTTPGDNNLYDEYNDGSRNDKTGRQGQLLRLSAWIDMDSRLTVGCAGALLTYVGRRKAVEYLPGNASASNTFRISNIETFTLKGMM